MDPKPAAQPTRKASTRGPRRTRPRTVRSPERVSEIALRSISQGVLITTPEGTILSVNPAFCAITGFSEADLVGFKCDVLLGQLIDPSTANAIHEARRLGREFSGEILDHRKDGTPFWNDLTITPVQNNRGQVTHFIAITRDISTRKEAEALLIIQKDLLERIASGAPLRASLTALALAIEAHCGDVLCSVLLLDKDGARLNHGAAPSLPEEYCRAINGVAIGPSAGSCGTAAYRRAPVVVEDISTDPLWANFRALALAHGLRACWSIPILDPRQKLLGTFAIYRCQPGPPVARHERVLQLATDIAVIAIGEEQAATALMESEERFRRALDATRDGLWDWNIETGQVYFSPQWARLLGYVPEEIPPRAEFFYSVLHPDDLERVTQGIEDHLAGRTTEKQAQVRLRVKGGDYRWFLDRGKVVDWDPVGRPLRMVGTITDITEQKRTERRVNIQARLAYQLNHANTIAAASRLIVDVAEELIGWDAAVLVILNEKSGLCRSVLNIDLVDGRKTDLLDESDNSPPTARMRKTLESGAELILRHEPGEQTEGLELFGDKTRRSASLLFVPIRDSQSIVGMLSIQSYQRDAYQPADLDTLQSLADHCGGALSRIISREALDESEGRLREAQAIAHIGNFHWDARTNKVTWSDELYRIHGRERGAFEPNFESYIAAVHPDDRARVLENLQSAMRTTAPFDHDYRLVLPGGQVRWVHARGIATLDDEGKFAGMEGICQDIDGRKQAEQALRLFRTLVDQSSDTFEVIDPATSRFLDVNEKGPAELGCTRAEYLAMRVVDIDPTVSESRWPELAGKIQAAGSLTGEGMHRRKDGTTFPIEFNARWVHLDRPYIVTVVRDVTERRQAGEALRASREQLRNLARRLQVIREEERTSIAREIHDVLAQDLTRLKLDLAWLGRRFAQPLTEATRGGLVEKLTSMLELADLTIGSVQRLATDLRPVVLDSLGLGPAIEWLTEEFQRRTGIACIARVSRNLPAVERPQATALFRIVQESLTNVTRHACALRVEVTLEADEHGLRLTIQDDGRGITSAELADYKSIGLLGMKERAALLGGETEIYAASGGGTVVSVKIPSPAPAKEVRP